MVTAAELKAARVAMSTCDREGVQRALDLLKREGGSMPRAQLDEARAQGFDVVGIIVRDAPSKSRH